MISHLARVEISSGWASLYSWWVNHLFRRQPRVHSSRGRTAVQILHVCVCCSPLVPPAFLHSIYT